LKFDLEGIGEVTRKFFGTLHNTYSFFTLYANIDGFTYAEEDIKFEERPEIDRWILSELNSLIKIADESYGSYEPTRAGRAIQHFTDAFLSNWYVRLSRRRFWKGDYTKDKISAYQTLYTCLTTIAQLAAPIAPFYTDRLFNDLNAISSRSQAQSIHHTDLPKYDENMIDSLLEQRMQMAQKLSSMVLGLRKKERIRVRQPLNKMMIPVDSDLMEEQIDKVKDLILSEVNVKELSYIRGEENNMLVKSIKPNFKALGPKYGKLMKPVSAYVNTLKQSDIATLESGKELRTDINGQEVIITLEDVEITTQDIPGWTVSNMDQLTVALDITLNDELINEGLSRDFVNRIQNLRKERAYDVVDKISLKIESGSTIEKVINDNYDYICSETLTEALEFVSTLDSQDTIEEIDLADDILVKVVLTNVSKS
jgi:isoleucyl-tRNA synthetase